MYVDVGFVRLIIAANHGQAESDFLAKLSMVTC